MDRVPTVVVAIMDRDDWSANTDNIVVVDPARRSLTWVPRDLWSSTVGDRINRAWAIGGFELLRVALAEHGFAVQAGVCFRRGVVSAHLARLMIDVPVDRRLTFRYPTEPERPIEEGSIVVTFEPPVAHLSGDGVHQWVGARSVLVGDGSDLDRIRRQQTLVRELLRSGHDPSGVLDDATGVAVDGADALVTLRSVTKDWTTATFDQVVPTRIEGKDVLVRRTPSSTIGSAGRRAVRRIGRSAATRVRMPSGGLLAPPRRTRLVAAIAVRDEARFLPGFLTNVAPHVDGIVALDDGSTDGSSDILRADPAVLEVIEVQRRTRWDEVGNHRRLVETALRHGATWIVSLDADERVEATFRDRVERVVRRGRLLALDAFALPMHELWDDERTWRVDGPWGRKRVPRLFAARSDHRFDDRELHAAKAPLQGKRLGTWITADVRLYHLRMIRPADRTARRQRYEALDPDHVWQPSGYAYLDDERGIRLRSVSRRRGVSGSP
jgi:hypothetical protein